MNPILPLHVYVPDVEARQWKDGRTYLYGSFDICGGTNYCSFEYHTYSSDDLIHWKDHGVIFRSDSVNSNSSSKKNFLFAPDCIYKDGKYYLYYCMSDRSEGVAVADSPDGPFINPTPIAGADGDGIDPAVFIDDDGQAYYYWGQNRLRGARLKPNMKEIDWETFCPSLITREEHGFHEGSSIRKRNGIYYLVYTDISKGRATCISYAMGPTPFGPFEKGGVIIDNTGCDPESWNNHGSIAEINGKWYVFYHRSTHNSKFSRRVCVEPIYFTEDGRINEVEMTTQGVSPPIDCNKRLEASRACLLSGKVYIDSIHTNEGYQEYLSGIENGDWAAFKYLNFDLPFSKFSVLAASAAYGGQIEIRLNSPEGELLGTVSVGSTGGWQKWEEFSCPVRKIRGKQALYLVFKGSPGRLFSVKSFSFMEG